MEKNAADKYLIPVAAKTLDVLEAFTSQQEELTLREVVERTRIAHTTAFRILFTLVHRGYLIQSGKKYRLAALRRRVKVGYAGLSEHVAISVEAGRSLEAAARRSGIDTVFFDNRDDPRVALENAHKMVESRVDVAIEFQNDIQMAPAIADVFNVAKILTIALHIPQPGAIYFGPNNYRAGWDAGLALAEHANRQWQGVFDLLLLLDIPRGGAFLQARMSGALAGLAHALGPVPQGKVVRQDGGGDRKMSREVTLRVLRRRGNARRILASATSDESALGAHDALCELGLAETSAIVGHDGSEEALERIAGGGSPLMATVGFFPSAYGPALVDIVFRLMRGEYVPPFVYVSHMLLDRNSLVLTPRAKTNFRLSMGRSSRLRPHAGRAPEDGVQ